MDVVDNICTAPMRQPTSVGQNLMNLIYDLDRHLNWKHLVTGLPLIQSMCFSFSVTFINKIRLLIKLIERIHEKLRY